MPCGGSASDGKTSGLLWMTGAVKVQAYAPGFEISLRCLNSARLNLCFSASEICFVRLHNSGAVAVGA